MSFDFDLIQKQSSVGENDEFFLLFVIGKRLGIGSFWCQLFADPVYIYLLFYIKSSTNIYKKKKIRLSKLHLEADPRVLVFHN